MMILASSSPIRSALLRQAGIAVEAVPARVNEREIEAGLVVNGATPEAVALGLAEAKALAVSGGTVVGADQILELDGAILHKPESLDAARERLDALRGRTHRLHTAVALAHEDRLVWSHAENAELTMRRFTDAERDAALAAEGRAALGSAGAYRLEGPSIQLFEKIRGDYFAILGLPLLPLLGALRRHATETLEGFT